MEYQLGRDAPGGSADLVERHGQAGGEKHRLPYTDYISRLLLVPLYFSFHCAQQFINISCGDPQGISNSKLTGANWAWMIAGAVFCLLAAVGLFMPELGK